LIILLYTVHHPKAKLNSTGKQRDKWKAMQDASILLPALEACEVCNKRWTWGGGRNRGWQFEQQMKRRTKERDMGHSTALKHDHDYDHININEMCGGENGMSAALQIS
jgi:hypothetical protein